ncbi:MAG: VWA domain-containing protein [bacterium]|nr:VWA domain-containing protein [bacterium]
MRNALLFVLLGFLALPVLAGVRIGVLYFDVAAPDDTYDYLSTGMAEMLMTDLANQPDMTVVERERLDQVLAEHSLSGSGVTDPGTAVELGRILGLDLMVMGSLTVVEGCMRLDAQVLFVESGEVAGGVRAETTDTGGVFEMVDLVSRQLVDKIRSLRYGKGYTPVVFVDPNSDAPRVDVAFFVDTTGSMGDEIEVVKQEMRKIAVNIAQGTPSPAVRFAIVVYRDRGDEYVTQLTDFTYDILAVQEVIDAIYAGGGGDEEESVFRAMDDGINDLSWDSNHEVTKLAFLLGDAGPHEYSDEYYTLDDAVDDANDRGISIFAIGCSGLSAYGENSFKQVAFGTNGSFEYLSYRKTYVDDSGRVASYIYEGDHVYDEEAVHRELADSGVIDEDTSVFDVGVARATVAEEAIAAGEVDKDTEAYHSGGAVGGVTASPTSVSDDTRDRAETTAAERAYTGDVSGTETSVDNNLDKLVTQVVQSNVASRSGVTYDMGHTQARIQVRQGDQVYWIPVTDSRQLARLEEAAGTGETVWLAAGVKDTSGEEGAEAPMAFRSGSLTVLDSSADAPTMTQRSLADLEEDPTYYMNNGLGDENQWSFEAEIMAIEYTE